MRKLLFAFALVGLSPVVASAQTSELIPTDYEMMAEAIDEIADGRALVIKERLRAKPFLTDRRFYDFFATMREAFPDMSEIAIQDYGNRNALAYPLAKNLVLRQDWRYGPSADLNAAVRLAEETGTACALEARVPGVDWARNEALVYVRQVCSDGLESELYVALAKQGKLWITTSVHDPNAPPEDEAEAEN